MSTKVSFSFISPEPIDISIKVVTMYLNYSTSNWLLKRRDTFFLFRTRGMYFSKAR